MYKCILKIVLNIKKSCYHKLTEDLVLSIIGDVIADESCW